MSWLTILFTLVALLVPVAFLLVAVVVGLRMVGRGREESDASGPEAPAATGSSDPEAPAATGSSAPGADPSPGENLHDLIEAGDRSAVEVRLAAGADPDAPNDHGIPPLHHAAKHGQVEIMAALLDAGADLEATDGSGRTAFDFATDLCKDPAPTRFLLSRGAEVADPERSMRNAWSEATRELLSEHFGQEPPEPPPPAPEPTPVTDEEWGGLLPRIEQVFADLRDQQILSELDAGFTQQMGLAEVQALAADMSPEARDALVGFCFTTTQDMERAVERGHMPIGFGAAQGEQEVAVQVGERIVAAFEQAGFDVEWDGSSSMRPTVLVRSGL